MGRSAASKKFIAYQGETGANSHVACAEAFAELNHMVRELGLDDYLSVDGTALMKEIYAKRRLSEDQLESLRVCTADDAEELFELAMSQRADHLRSPSEVPFNVARLRSCREISVD